jgi:hypothetical protein
VVPDPTRPGSDRSGKSQRARDHRGRGDAVDPERTRITRGYDPHGFCDRHRTDSDRADSESVGSVERPDRTRDPDGTGHAVEHRGADDVKRSERPDLHPDVCADVRPDPGAELGPGFSGSICAVMAAPQLNPRLDCHVSATSRYGHSERRAETLAGSRS